ncbi:MAG: hypothetical protein IH973_03875, partial [Myxococcales bacterium]|nr:hypothetical protein [Myxococcales bacterium]
DEPYQQPDSDEPHEEQYYEPETVKDESYDGLKQSEPVQEQNQEPIEEFHSEPVNEPEETVQQTEVSNPEPIQDSTVPKD